MTNALNDALSVPDQIQIPAGSVINASLGTSACSGTKVSPEYPVLLTGSPAYGSLAVQAGAAATSAGSVAWVVPGKAFAAAPFAIKLTPLNGNPASQLAGSPITAGSFLVTSVGGSVPFSWLAIGSGRV